MENPATLASHREFTSWLAELGGSKVVICSTGIGGPSTAIAVEELAQLGIRTFVRIGTTGAIQPGIQPGEMIITTAAVRLDGASLHYAPLSFPAVADFQVTSALVAAASSQQRRFHLGISVSSDTFYPGQERYDTYSGTVLDSARLKYALGEHLEVDSRSVHAFIVGEHGDSEVVAWSSANVSGVELHKMCEMRGHYKHKENTEEIAANVKNSAYEIINRKHATYYGIAMSVRRIC